MREIKFRGLNPLTKTLMDVCSIDWVHDEVYFEQGTDVAYRIDDCKLMQFTGLRDKNGVEIYEDDVTPYLEVGELKLNAKVYYSELCAQFRVTWIENGRRYNDSLIDCDNWFEVIGNANKNPELLGG